MDIKTKIGKRLKELREEKSLRLKDVILGIQELSTTRLSNYEQGERMLPIDIAIKLADKLKVQPEYLLLLSDRRSKGIEVEGDEERKLLYYFRGMTEEHKADLLAGAKMMHKIDKARTDAEEMEALETDEGKKTISTRKIDLLQ